MKYLATTTTEDLTERIRELTRRHDIRSIVSELAKEVGKLAEITRNWKVKEDAEKTQILLKNVVTMMYEKDINF